MKRVSVSAPGKLLLLGEHAVIYNYPCIVTAVSQRVYVSVQKTETDFLEISAPQIDLYDYKKKVKSLGRSTSKNARFVEVAVKNFFQKYNLTAGLKIETESDFSAEFGFGSSSAVTVGTLKALSELFAVKLSQKQLFDLSYKTVLDVQKVGSGFDIAAAIFGGTLSFTAGGKEIEPLTDENLPLVVGYTGIKADTPTLVMRVAKLKRQYQKIVDHIFVQIGDLVNDAKKALLVRNYRMVGELMNFNQGLLDSLGVNTENLSKLIFAARSAGAYGAKLSGAGGGDCMIALCPKSKVSAVHRAIRNKGGLPIDVKTSAEGVRIEVP